MQGLDTHLMGRCSKSVDNGLSIYITGVHLSPHRRSSWSQIFLWARDKFIYLFSTVCIMRTTLIKFARWLHEVHLNCLSPPNSLAQWVLLLCIVLLTLTFKRDPSIATTRAGGLLWVSAGIVPSNWNHVSPSMYKLTKGKNLLAVDRMGSHQMCWIWAWFD